MSHGGLGKDVEKRGEEGKVERSEKRSEKWSNRVVFIKKGNNSSAKALA